MARDIPPARPGGLLSRRRAEHPPRGLRPPRAAAHVAIRNRRDPENPVCFEIKKVSLPPSGLCSRASSIAISWTLACVFSAVRSSTPTRLRASSHMGGIYGMIRLPASQVRPATERMPRAMVHRGPDDDGLADMPLAGDPAGPVAAFKPVIRFPMLSSPNPDWILRRERRTCDDVVALTAVPGSRAIMRSAMAAALAGLRRWAALAAVIAAGSATASAAPVLTLARPVD